LKRYALSSPDNHQSINPRLLCRCSPHDHQYTNQQSRSLRELDERSTLLLSFAQVLFVNGQATDQMLAATAQLGGILGLRLTTEITRWGELHFKFNDGSSSVTLEASANPSDLNMARVSEERVTFRGFIFSEFAGNPTGGVLQGTALASEISLGADVNFGKLMNSGAEHCTSRSLRAPEAVIPPVRSAT
jgi:hypothetical protein